MIITPAEKPLGFLLVRKPVGPGRLGSRKDIAARHFPLSLRAPFLIVIARSFATKQSRSAGACLPLEEAK